MAAVVIVRLGALSLFGYAFAFGVQFGPTRNFGSGIYLSQPKFAGKHPVVAVLFAALFTEKGNVSPLPNGPPGLRPPAAGASPPGGVGFCAAMSASRVSSVLNGQVDPGEVGVGLGAGVCEPRSAQVISVFTLNLTQPAKRTADNRMILGKIRNLRFMVDSVVDCPFQSIFFRQLESINQLLRLLPRHLDHRRRTL